jgi:hypothetical protein
MFRSFVLTAALACSVTPLFAADKSDTFTSAEEAGADFKIQGEYLGSVDGETWGAQVIALGDGKFDAVGFKGGLPGEGWKRGEETRKGTGKAEDGKVTLSGNDWKGSIANDTITINDGGKDIGTLKKVTRKSPTEGAKAPEGATILFDGSNADAWQNGKVVDGKYLAAGNVSTKEKFGDHTLHIEFRTPFMPKARGQGRGNSGVYLQGRYECQVLDSFGLDGADNECGGIYSINKPIVNMCYPPLSWQTYDIEFKAAKYDGDKKVENARATIKHNGVVIHDNLELTKGTPGKDPEGPNPNVIFLQDHGNPVVYKNIWVVKK